MNTFKRLTALTFITLAFAFSQNLPAEEVEALYNLAIRIENGDGCAKDEVKAHLIFLKLANMGFARSMSHVASSYWLGRGTERNVAESMKWFHKAADDGKHGIAQFKIGLIYLGRKDFSNKGVKRDEAKGVNYLELAAQQGVPEAVCALGSCYGLGIVKPKNEARAMELFHRAATLGSKLAKEILAEKDAEAKERTRRVAEWLFDEVFRNGGQGNDSGRPCQRCGRPLPASHQFRGYCQSCLP